MLRASESLLCRLPDDNGSEQVEVFHAVVLALRKPIPDFLGGLIDAQGVLQDVVGPSVCLKSSFPRIDIFAAVGKILRQNGHHGRVTQRATTKGWILSANPAYSHLARPCRLGGGQQCQW